MLKSRKNYNLKAREKGQSQRQLQVSRAAHVVIADCLRKESKLDWRLEGCPMSITKVNISADLSVINCFFLPFNTNLSTDEILDALEKSKFVIRAYVTKQINLKFSPEIRFYFDVSYEKMALIESLSDNK